MTEKRIVCITDVCSSIFAGGDAPKKQFSFEQTEDCCYPVFSNGESNNGLYGFTNTARVTEPSITVSARGTIGFTAIRLTPFTPIVRLISITPIQDIIDIDYLYYALSNYTPENTGTSIPQLTVPMIKKYKFRLPEKEEQKRAVKVLKQIDDILKKEKKQIQKLDELIKSRFVEMFGDINQSEFYPYKRVQDFTTVVSGGTPNRDNDEYWKNGHIPWVKTTELRHSEIENTEEYITEKALTESSAKIVPPGTVLIAMYGQGKTRGMTGLLKIPASTNQACACVLPCNEMNCIYLWKFFELSYSNLRNLAKGGNQPNLNSALIKNYPVLFPPLDLQNQFADFVTQVDTTKSAVNQSIEKLETLKKSLMQEYFQ